MTRRLFQLYLGLILYGFAIALMIRANLGLDPWDVFHQGLSDRTGASVGTVVILVGLLILLFWIPLRQKPGVGTLSNMIVIGLVIDFCLWVLPGIESISLRGGMLVLSILLSGLASGAYIGAGLGPGPRDGLMTGIVARTGWKVRSVRTSIELGVLAIGWLLGGTVGIGTILYALAIGPIIHVTLPWFTIPGDIEAKGMAPV